MKPVIKTGTWSLIATAVRRRWLMVLVAVVVTPIVAVGVNKAMPNRYKATAKVLIQESKAINPILNDKMVDWNVKNRIQVLQELIRGSTILEKVLRQRGEITDKDSPQSIEAKVSRFRREVEVFGVANTMAQLTVTQGSPEATYQTLTLLVSTFINEMLRPQKESITESAEFLRVQIERLRGELAVDEQRLATYKADNATTLPEVFHQNLDMTLQLRKALAEADTDLQAALRRKRLTEARLRSQTPASRQVEVKLLEARARLRDLRGAYTEEHPVVETQRAVIARLEREHDSLAPAAAEIDLSHLEALASSRGGDQRLGVGMDGKGDLLSSDILNYKAVLGEIEGARGKLSAVRSRLAVSDSQLRDFARNEQNLTHMVRDLDAKSKVYRDLLVKYEDALVTRELALYDEKGQVWVVEPPTRPSHSTKPATAIVAIGGLFAGIVLGIVLAAAAQLLSGVVRRDLVSTIVGVDLVGTLGSRSNP
ncbi:MAG: Wzz/FepE/Etk N-terminal domain-containing protein [Deltaproteobacteria bacterium]